MTIYKIHAEHSRLLAGDDRRKESRSYYDCNAVHTHGRNSSGNIQKKWYEMIIPVDGGESAPMERNMVDDRANAPKKPNVVEVGIGLRNTTSEASSL